MENEQKETFRSLFFYKIIPSKKKQLTTVEVIYIFKK